MDTPISQSETRERLRTISRALQDLHRALLAYQRQDYEKYFGRIGSDFYVLQLAAEDPQFAWLRALSAEIIRIDEMGSGKEAIDPVELQLTGNRVRFLLTPTAEGNSFQSHYQRAMQTTPDIIMAHAAAMKSLPAVREVTLFRSGPPEDDAHPGSGSLAHHPGSLVPGHGDHGYRALAAVVEVALDPGAASPVESFANEDCIILVVEGEVHAGATGEQSVAVDPSHLVVLNAGTGLEYRLGTPSDGAAARMVQAYIRPSAIGQDPGIQHGEIPGAEADTWRKLAGPEDEDAPFHVRNRVTMSDVSLQAGHETSLPSLSGWDTVIFVVEGQVEIDGVPFARGMSGIAIAPEDVTIKGIEPARVLAFSIDPNAKVTRAGRTAR